MCKSATIPPDNSGYKGAESVFAWGYAHANDPCAMAHVEKIVIEESLSVGPLRTATRAAKIDSETIHPNTHFHCVSGSSSQARKVNIG
jgi:hypothetical protein